MASVRGNLNIQFLIELSSENLFNIVVDCTRTRHARPDARIRVVRYRVSRMGF